jgi:3'-phosphoadenosine 5'-phosphosulfate sulfotransferase (PAPS reductase)/FAD synthetase
MSTKHVVGFSGGIDSQACAGWVLERFPKEDVVLMNSDAGGNEHPLTVAHVEWYSEHVHPVEMLKAIVADLQDIGTRDGATGDRRRSLGEDSLLTFDRLAFVKGRFPSKKAQFCTEYLKLAPQKRALEPFFEAGDEVIRYAGVRADESRDRAKLPERQWDTYYDCELVRPILKWTKKQCFDFVKARGEKINPLYTLGFSRVGCAPCVNSSKDDVREWAARFPEMIDKVRAWEKSVGRTFFPPCVPRPEYRRELAAWQARWVEVIPPEAEGEEPVTRVKDGAPEPPAVPINWIDEVVEWSRTTRGGKQYALPFVEVAAEQGSCSSKYGLCE